MILQRSPPAKGIHMSTDQEWEKWGAKDPYFAVLTNSKFRRTNLDTAAREEFLSAGRDHVDHVIKVCRERLNPSFTPRRILDFGCGVGRLLLPFAVIATEVVGIDVSPSMLAEAKKNCDDAGIGNVRLALSDDSLSRAIGIFDLVHSCIVLQHIEIARGLILLKGLVAKTAPGGICAIHLTFAWDHFAINLGIEPPPLPVTPPSAWRRAIQALRRAKPAKAESRPEDDPEMQMNFYNMSQVLFLLHQAGIEATHLEFTDHGGAVGATMYFLNPRRDVD